jgi:hypothetical protein
MKIAVLIVFVFLLSILNVQASDSVDVGEYKCVTQNLVGISAIKQGQFDPLKGESLFYLKVSKRKINNKLCEADLINYIKNPFSEKSRSLRLDVQYCINTYKIDIKKAENIIGLYSIDGLNYSGLLGMEHFHLVKLNNGKLSYKYYYGFENSYLEKGTCSKV